MLILGGRPEEALPKIAPALQRYTLHLEDDSGPGYPLLKAWVALIHLRAGRYADTHGAMRDSIAVACEVGFSLEDGDFNGDWKTAGGRICEAALATQRS